MIHTEIYAGTKRSLASPNEYIHSHISLATTISPSLRQSPPFIILGNLENVSVTIMILLVAESVNFILQLLTLRMKT